MDKVIILKGASNKGKTPTLHLLIDLLISQGATIIYQQNYSSNINTDCFVILDVPNLGLTGIITYGDAGCEQGVQDSLQKCLQLDCIAVVGASHVRYYKSPTTVYKILWDFGARHNAKTIETSNIIKADGWGAPINETHLNTICAENLINILYKL
ncbi:MAG: hypothetical protein K2H76_01945 [Muribaculaceae bacterium]|nr:hypothetical protein [Muribaculaceae bacterium]